MYGSDTGVLKLEVSKDDGVSWIEVFIKSGEQQNDETANWLSESISLDSDYNGKTIKFRLSGITGNGFKSDMAVDGFTMTASLDSSLGIQDELLSTFNLYPNPSDIGEIKLTVPNEIQEFSIEISNIFQKI